MIDILNGLLDIVTTLIMFVINTISSLINLIVNIPTYVSVLINSLNVLPAFVLPWSIAFVSLVVVQYILNRRAQ